MTTARARQAETGAGQRINVPGVGRVVTAAYEQLRNAAEYTQEHLLRQRAIRRFYARNLQFHTESKIDNAIADELVIELTQAGYIANNSLPVSVTEQLRGAISRHYGNFWRMRQAGVTYEYSLSLALDLLSVDSERLLGEDPAQTAFTVFAYRHYLSVLPKDAVLAGSNTDHYEDSLFVAVHKALRKSDLAVIRHDMQRMYATSDSDIHAYVQFYVTVDGIYYSEHNDKLTRYINRYGAPLRVLKEMMEDAEDIDDLLPDRQRFLDVYVSHIRHAYDRARDRLNKGLAKSIIFLLITKALIGLAIEIPYDLWITGTVAVLPLAMNLLAPVVYMVVLRLGLRLPGETNTTALAQYADDMLYGTAGKELYPSVRKRRYSLGFTIVYVLTFFLVFGAVISQLIALHFNVVQGVIFFVFLATASFLGFRLSRIVRELELVTSRPGALATARDLLYLPFILLGQWLSDKYARVNLIAMILDTVIELPLKTILRLVRQWTDFISEKKDAI